MFTEVLTYKLFLRARERSERALQKRIFLVSKSDMTSGGSRGGLNNISKIGQNRTWGKSDNLHEYKCLLLSVCRYMGTQCRSPKFGR